MRMAVVFGMNQVVSHGFGLFLFAALVPMMREDVGLSYWHIALAGALTQLAYLGGALMLGVLGPKIGARKVSLSTGVLSTSLLLAMPFLNDPNIIIGTLIVLAASAAMSWGSIVDVISRCAPMGSRSTYLSSASSGTAWGYGISGLIILWVVPLWGWKSTWLLAGVCGLAVLMTTWWMLRTLQEPARDIDSPIEIALTFPALLKTLITERTAFLACLICFMVGFSTMPFSNWLNTYLEELTLPAELGGYSWTVVGVTGMAAGVITGKFADLKGHSSALLLIFTAFAIGMVAFSINPIETVLLASFGYGLMYFPMWGIVAGWVNQRYSATATMQISGICMVTFGMGGALGNLIIGAIHETFGSLQLGFTLLASVSFLLFLVGLFIKLSSNVSQIVLPPSSPAQ